MCFNCVFSDLLLHHYQLYSRKFTYCFQDRKKNPPGLELIGSSWTNFKLRVDSSCLKAGVVNTLRLTKYFMIPELANIRVNQPWKLNHMTTYVMLSSTMPIIQSFTYLQMPPPSHALPRHREALGGDWYQCSWTWNLHISIYHLADTSQRLLPARVSAMLLLSACSTL